MQTLRIILFFLISCIIFGGNIYKSKIKSNSDIKICITDKSYEADLIVYITKYEWEARDSDFIWFIVDKPYYSDVKIFFVRSYEADIKVFFVNEYRKSWCGWKTNKEDKYRGYFE